MVWIINRVIFIFILKHFIAINNCQSSVVIIYVKNVSGVVVTCCFTLLFTSFHSHIYAYCKNVGFTFWHIVSHCTFCSSFDQLSDTTLGPVYIYIYRPEAGEFL